MADQVLIDAGEWARLQADLERLRAHSRHLNQVAWTFGDGAARPHVRVVPRRAFDWAHDDREMARG